MVRQERLATIGKLAGSVSHELRNPLGVITNSIFYLERAVPRVDPKIARHFDIICEQALRATEIITDLLSLTQVPNENVSEVMIPALLDRVLREHVKVSSDIVVQHEYPPDLPPALADARRVARVFTNLVTNAFQAMRAGGTLTIRAWHEDGMVAVAIHDTGPGILAGITSKIFEPLFSTKTRGIGLGLTVAKDIVEGYGGRIDVASNAGEGTTFTVRLPAAR